MKKFLVMLAIVSPLLMANPQVFDSTELTKYLEVCATDTKYLTTQDKHRGLELTAKLEVAVADNKVKIINPPKADIMRKCIDNLMKEVDKNGN